MIPKRRILIRIPCSSPEQSPPRASRPSVLLRATGGRTDSHFQDNRGCPPESSGRQPAAGKAIAHCGTAAAGFTTGPRCPLARLGENRKRGAEQASNRSLRIWSRGTERIMSNRLTHAKQRLPVQHLQFGVDQRGVLVPILRPDKGMVLRPELHVRALRPKLRACSKIY